MRKIKDILLMFAVIIFMILMVAMCVTSSSPRPDISDDPHEAIRIR